MYEHLINNRPYSTFSNIREEFALENDKNYLFELDYLSLINIEGDRAAEFLQGQLTCDVRKVDESQMQQGALCNLKGRVQALLDVIKWQGYRLVLPHDLIADTLTTLSKTALVSRVTPRQDSAYKVYGFSLSNLADLLPLRLNRFMEANQFEGDNKACWYALSKNYYLVILHNDIAAPLVQSFALKHQLRGSLAWHRLQLERLKVEIYPDTRGLFLPHRIDLPAQGYISFDKGCYKGQEIIARTHYRAKIKHGLEKFYIHTDQSLQAGAILVDSENVEVGELIDYCPLGENQYLIVVSILREHPEEIYLKGSSVALLR